MRAMLSLHERPGQSPRPREPLTDCSMCSMRALIVSPKEIIRRHLKERKENARKPSVSEKELLDALDILKGAARSDKETEDLIYALSDVCPHDSVKRKAIEALKK